MIATVAYATIPYDVRAVLRPAEVLLIVPPFAGLDRPALGVHLLQGLARRMGIEVQVLYANVLFAAVFGERDYVTLSRMQASLFLGERLFARAAFGGPPLGRDHGEPIDRLFAAARADYTRAGRRFGLTSEALLRIEARIPAWLESFVPALAAAAYRVVGCTSSFEQIAPSLAILGELKRRSPRILTILGGANCEGEMGDGLAAIADSVDCIFAGESEATFVDFLGRVRRGEPPPARILRGQPCAALDNLPTPDYHDYYAQMRAFLPRGEALAQSRVAYETSRGCWWGEKAHCTFCGLNGEGMASREKSPDRAITELRALVARHPNGKVALTDNIMPHAYFRTLLPRLAKELPGLSMMYEQKANLTLRQVFDLCAAGIREIQPGIEALSTGLLKLMAKGTTCAQNLALLRYARVTGMIIHWNLLHGFPNDELGFYQETLELLPLLRHLPPPYRLNAVSVDRFSPYHMYPERYGVRDLRAAPPYHAWLPEGAPVDKIAYHFDATFASESLAHPELTAQIDDEIAAWRRAWRGGVSCQLIVERRGGDYQLTDTRGLAGLPRVQIIDEARAVAALVDRPLAAAERPGDAWARAQRVVVERDRRLVPLAVAPAELLAELEARFRRRGALVALAS